jgi:hypothetical protein
MRMARDFKARDPEWDMDSRASARVLQPTPGQKNSTTGSVPPISFKNLDAIVAGRGGELASDWANELL